ncbi:tyrosine-type recombinase/integrase [Aurantimonas sp. A3-2-R12]|uniref:tyrosine-type recombinase/integrase n=1 Tax=Aurantimonas sp. A3-2-R12 TaxID=3114362 RepID=UPI002E17EC1C|nr:tyrosine-type recombinase/integrase [Aurantimonas sp. A3-2-R12]
MRLPTGTLAALVAEFKASSEYTTKAPKTRKAYDRYAAMIEKRFGKMSLAVVQDRRARGDFKTWRDTFADKPRTADYIWQTLARVLSVAKDNGRITINVCERGGRIYIADRAEKIWSAEHIEAMMSAASEPLRLALVLGLWTGQREGDLLRLSWTAYDGQFIRLRQGKTKARVKIPVGDLLRTALDAAKNGRTTTTILANTRGKPWTEDGFRTSWGKAAGKAGIDDLRFHDLRGTAVTRLALSGCSVPEIASITGHSLKDVENILDAHYLGGRFELAEEAIRKRERYEGRTDVAN